MIIAHESIYDIPKVINFSLGQTHKQFVWSWSHFIFVNIYKSKITKRLIVYGYLKNYPPLFYKTIKSRYCW